MKDHAVGPIVIWGAGITGKRILQELGQEEMANVMCIVDNSSSKWGTSTEFGIPIVSPNDIYDFSGQVIVGCAGGLALARQLSELRCRDVSYSYNWSLSWHTVVPHWKQNANELEKVRRILCDRTSSQTLDLILNSPSQPELDAIPIFDTYFDQDCLPFPRQPATVIICGANEGEELAALSKRGDRIHQLLLIEPQASAASKASAICRKLMPPDVPSRVLVAAVGEFDGTGLIGGSGPSAHLRSIPGARENEPGEVEICAIDNLDCLDRSIPGLMTFDIEGSEMAALRGGRMTLSSGKFAVAVSVYHRPNDLFEVVAYLNSLPVSWSFSIRMHDYGLYDLTLYAVPSDFSR